MDRREAFKKVLVGSGLVLMSDRDVAVSSDQLAKYFESGLETGVSCVYTPDGSEYTSNRVFTGPCNISYIGIGPCGVQGDYTSVHNFVDQNGVERFPIATNYRATFQFFAPLGAELRIPAGATWTLVSKIGKYGTSDDGKAVISSFVPAESEFVTIVLVKKGS